MSKTRKCAQKVNLIPKKMNHWLDDSLMNWAYSAEPCILDTDPRGAI